MEYKKLNNFSDTEITDCFNEAFSDYFQPIHVTEAQFQFMNRIRGAQYEKSIGAMENGKLIGLIINAIRKWDGELTAYDCGTGIVPDYRGKGISKEMFKRCLTMMKDE